MPLVKYGCFLLLLLHGLQYCAYWLDERFSMLVIQIACSDLLEMVFPNCWHGNTNLTSLLLPVMFPDFPIPPSFLFCGLSTFPTTSQKKVCFKHKLIIETFIHNLGLDTFISAAKPIKRLLNHSVYWGSLAGITSVFSVLSQFDPSKKFYFFFTFFFNSWAYGNKTMKVLD